MVTVRVRGEESGLKSPRRGALTSVSARSVPKREQRRRPLGNRGASVFSSRGRPCQGVPIMAARSMIIPHAGSDETFCSLRKVAAARARGARRPSGAEEGVSGKLAEPQTARREPAPARAGGSREPGPEAHAQRATGGAACRCCLHPRSARRRAVVGAGPPPPPAETSSRLEMVLLCPFGMSHVWAREV